MSSCKHYQGHSARATRCQLFQNARTLKGLSLCLEGFKLPNFCFHFGGDHFQFPLLPCQHVNISKSCEERLSCTGQTATEFVAKSLQICLRLDQLIFISFPDPSISIPHYPQTFIYPIHSNTLVPFTLKPSILPALCCHCSTPVWITEL